ncbi:hypothetical protein AT959_18615 [Dechloromonas denitrificans]|uniref:Uncharacterized protein n=1 Tax=Dechloromonas denitrificans TaxID=281362 RepID=A0A133XE72_9RHOO|nr:hypothetical protein AT959_18615 [Dechloromonas denitrificans]
MKLFQSIFGGNEQPGRYAESLIELAIERAVDGTDPRLRAVAGYRKRLREPIIHAIDHVVSLVALLPTPLSAASTEFSSDPRLKALFVSPEHMREVFGNDLLLSEFREGNATPGEAITALLLAERKEKQTFGMEVAGDMLRRDVAQITVSFSHHRLIDLSNSEDETRRKLRHRAFDHLISIALSRISDAKSERVELKHRHELLKGKLKVLQKGGWSIDDKAGEHADPAALQREFDEIDEQLAALSIDERTLGWQLDTLIEVLTGAEQQFWAENIDLYLDRMNIRRKAGQADAQLINFKELHNVLGQNMVMLFVSIKSDELPKRKSFAENADRCLAELGLSSQR